DLTKAIEKKNEEEIDDKKEENDSGKNLTSRNVNSKSIYWQFILVYSINCINKMLIILMCCMKFKEFFIAF
ncbi:hypothetical protein, partial [Mycoplasmopsis bovis]|uniref:hypothetical protein n=1 Tax=Mycoplasmopsis bovis TaxID=28903 RepID=UPI003D2DC71B